MKQFLANLLVRLAKDNPKDFKYIQIAAVILGAISAAFTYIDGLKVVLPSGLSFIESRTVWISSIVAIVIAQLPNKSPNDVPPTNPN